MGIEINIHNGVDINRALSDEIYAAQNINKLSGEDYGRVCAKYGDKVKIWEATDTTNYQISDEDFNIAKNNGRKVAEEKTGHDGSKQSWVRVAGDAVGSAVGALGAAAPKVLGKFTAKTANNVSKALGGDNHILGGSKETNRNVGEVTTIIMTAGVAANYIANKPNEDQYKAAMDLYNDKDGGGGLLTDGQSSLNEAQSLMLSATEQTTELTEEAEELNEEAGENIEEQKTEFDMNKKQFDFIKAKAQSGQQLRDDEKQVAQTLTPKMQESQTGITKIQEDIQTDLDDKFSTIEEFQTDFDTGAETIAEVQGVTEFAEGFDSATKTMSLIEGASQGINGASAVTAAGRLAAKSGGLGFWAVAGLVATGVGTGIASGIASAEQFSYAKRIGDEIDVREATQELNAQTDEVYNEELDNFVTNMDFIDNMELEVPEDLEISEETLPVSNENNVDPLAAGAAGIDVTNKDDNKKSDDNSTSLTSGINSNNNTQTSSVNTFGIFGNNQNADKGTDGANGGNDKIKDKEE